MYLLTYAYFPYLLTSSLRSVFILFLTSLQELHSEQLQRGMSSESSDSEEDGPQSAWDNPLAGRMRGLDDEDLPSSSEYLAEIATDAPVVGIDPDFC